MNIRNSVGFALNGAALVAGKAASRLRLSYLKLRFPGLTTTGSVHIGRGCHIYVHRGGAIRLAGCHVSRGATLTAGRDATLDIEADYIGQNATIVARDSLHIGLGTQIAENVVVRDGNHDRSVPLRDMAFTAAPIFVGENVWLAAGSIVLAGVSIGSNATVAAGAVVTKDVTPGATVGGVPARTLRSTWDPTLP